MFAFCPQTHTYTLSGKQLLSVTQVLREAGLIDARWYTDDAAQRGTFVHAAIALDQQHLLDDATLDAGLRPYFEAYQRFMADTDARFELIEHRVHDPLLGYAGTLDACGTALGRPVLCDFKTGTTPPWVGVQLAAYARLLPQSFRLTRYSVELRADATYRLRPWRDREDEQVFLAALRLVTWKRRNLL